MDQLLGSTPPAFAGMSVIVGIAELEISGAGANNVKLWTQSTKGTQITLTNMKKSWDLSDPTQRTEFYGLSANGIWIEGIAASAAERDVVITFNFKHNNRLISQDQVKATIVMINLANAVYRDNQLAGQADRGHAALVAGFSGPLTRANLQDDTKFTIIEMDGPTDNRTLDTMTNDPNSPTYGCYTNTDAITYVDRLRILLTAKWLVGHAAAITWTWNDAIAPSKWNGTLLSITKLRCDGLVEVCYEFNGIQVWSMFRSAARGGDNSLNYNITSQLDIWSYDDNSREWTAVPNEIPDNLEEHNDIDVFSAWNDTLQPATQCGHVAPVEAATTFTKQDLCSPFGTKGGN